MSNHTEQGAIDLIIQNYLCYPLTRVKDLVQQLSPDQGHSSHRSEGSQNGDAELAVVEVPHTNRGNSDFSNTVNQELLQLTQPTTDAFYADNAVAVEMCNSALNNDSTTSKKSDDEVFDLISFVDIILGPRSEAETSAEPSPQPESPNRQPTPTETSPNPPSPNRQPTPMGTSPNPPSPNRQPTPTRASPNPPSPNRQPTPTGTSPNPPSPNPQPRSTETSPTTENSHRALIKMIGGCPCEVTDSKLKNGCPLRPRRQPEETVEVTEVNNRESETDDTESEPEENVAQNDIDIDRLPYELRNEFASVLSEIWALLNFDESNDGQANI